MKPLRPPQLPVSLRAGVFLIALGMAVPVPAIAQDFPSSEEIQGDQDKRLIESPCSGSSAWLCSKQSRLVAHQPNTAAWEFSGDDDDALEVNYSFRYLLTRPDCSVEQGVRKQQCVAGWNARTEWFFSYTGKFDFYVGTRDSGPVLNRTSNPALHWRFNRPALVGWTDWIDVALEHRSNGQTTDYDLKDAAGRYVAEQRWLAGDRAYIDGISRGANYLSAQVRKRHAEFPVTWWLKGKVYLNEDSAVTWGDHQGSRIWDYDVVRLILQWKPALPETRRFGELEVNVAYTLGLKGFATDSLDASVYLSSFLGKRVLLPINYAAIHVGPMNELSNYTEPQTSVFVGLKLNPFPGK